MSFTIEKNKDLKDLNSFHLDVRADYYAEYSSAEELYKLSITPEFLDNEILNLGGGYNLLFAEDFHGMVLHSKIKGIKRYDKDENTVYAIAGAGEKWDDFVDWSINEGLGGVENLAGIPGTVGAAPIQNIGAYGCEVSSVIHNIECFDVMTRKIVTLTRDECHFGYRDSLFKKEGRGRYIVLRVSFRMRKSPEATVLTYGPLIDFKKRLGHIPSIGEVACEVRRIRNAKIPDPNVVGNVGSFFKNPVVRIYFYKEVMCSLYPDIPYYETDTPPYVKIPAGWLIEHAGLKGFKIGQAEVYPGNCLVIVNRGGALPDDILKLSDHLIKEVKKKFGVTLQPEVNIIDTRMKVTILGSGTSKGVPEVGCYCPVCTSDDPLDNRTRCSALIETRGMKLLIDISPDFRLQALREDISTLDGALITHNHYDHVGGIDDLRPFCALGKFPIYLRKDVNDDLHRRLDYCFRDSLYPGVPSFEMHEIENAPFLINGLKIVPVSVLHGKVPIVGYRIGKFAYLTDVKSIPEEEMDKLEGLEVLVINALRYKDHFAHLTLEEALSLINEIKPCRAYLTHFCHEIGKHKDFEKALPANVFPCYDGMVIELPL